jgi:hypothetical protein
VDAVHLIAQYLTESRARTLTAREPAVPTATLVEIPSVPTEGMIHSWVLSLQRLVSLL